MEASELHALSGGKSSPEILAVHRRWIYTRDYLRRKTLQFRQRFDAKKREDIYPEIRWRRASRTLFLPHVCGVFHAMKFWKVRRPDPKNNPENDLAIGRTPNRKQTAPLRRPKNDPDMQNSNLTSASTRRPSGRRANPVPTIFSRVGLAFFIPYSPMAKTAPPNFTQIPNLILESLAEISPAETKVAMVICRETFGWHQDRTRHPMPISAIEKTTGLSRQGVFNALANLLEKGWIKRYPDGQCFSYEINAENVAQPCNSVERSGNANHATECNGAMQLSVTVPCNSVERLEFDHIYEKEMVNKEKESEPSPEDIYKAFPLKVGKPKALAAIKKALKKIKASDLLEKTKAFAAARNGNLDYCRNPATWFNGEYFNDDPETWKPQPNGNGYQRKQFAEAQPDHDFKIPIETYHADGTITRENQREEA